MNEDLLLHSLLLHSHEDFRPRRLGYRIAEGGTKSPLGRKLLRTWILRPLLKEEDIHMRTEGIRFFASSGNLNLVGILSKFLRQVKDVPRMMLRLRQATASVMDWQNLMASISALHQIRYDRVSLRDTSRLSFEWIHVASRSITE